MNWTEREAKKDKKVMRREKKGERVWKKKGSKLVKLMGEETDNERQVWIETSQQTREKEGEK